MSSFQSNYFTGAVRQLLAFHGETITYNPVGGSPVSMRAIVRRYVPQENPQSPGRGNVKHIEIQIPNSATEGRASIDTGGDTVTIADRVGGATADRAVLLVVEQNESYWHLRLR